MDVFYGILLIAFFSVFVTLAIKAKKNRDRIVNLGVNVEGVVIEVINEPWRGQGGTYNRYAPIVKFETLDHEWITAKYSIGKYKADYQPGEKVTVFYDPADPKQLVIKKIK